MAKSKYIETLEEQYTKKDAKSVLRYKAPDNKWRYVQTSKDASGGNIPSGGGMTEVTWQELKDKRDNKQLTPGSLYRITDYQCTTTQENTQSAGHQFDIVLLALSANKLAEEGWAMMHDNIYDVTFADGVTKKCYIYEYTEGSYNVVEPDTLIGTSGEIGVEFVSIDDVNKVLICDPDYGPNSDGMTNEGLTYNYFQNSNLSAWKVWYCLDNDKSRFAWADDTNNKSIIVNNRYEHPAYYVAGTIIKGVGKVYAWVDDEENRYLTANEIPVINEQVFIYSNGQRTELGNVTAYIENPNGRGVIYRLIDEWNNDVAYDFKNIQFVRKLTDGELDTSTGTNTWVYTLNNIDEQPYDASLNTITSDNSTNNKIDSLYTFINDKNYFELPDVVILYGGGFNNISKSQIITILKNVVKMQGCQDCIIGNADSQFYICDALTTTESDAPAIYINNKKVLKEK